LCAVGRLLGGGEGNDEDDGFHGVVMSAFSR
jgi:hypothetical protein